jgi:dephospho-CoA kinase
MMIVGITGGIGSGKSTIGKIFATMGYPVYNSDDEAKNILLESEILHQKLKLELGESVFSNNLPDRKKIGEMVFSDNEKLEKLNGLIHTLVAEHFDNWLKNQK